jgi:hypothetical protein
MVKEAGKHTCFLIQRGKTKVFPVISPQPVYYYSHPMMCRCDEFENRQTADTKFVRRNSDSCGKFMDSQSGCISQAPKQYTSVLPQPLLLGLNNINKVQQPAVVKVQNSFLFCTFFPLAICVSALGSGSFFVRVHKMHHHPCIDLSIDQTY